MEACRSAHHWARRFQEMGVEVRLISPQYVTPFVKTNKNDRDDAEAIVEAAYRPAMRFVNVKSVEQQDMQAAHRVRELLVQQRTALINQGRGLLGERGITIAQSPAAFKRAVPEILKECDGEITSFCQTLMMELIQQVHAIEERIATRRLGNARLLGQRHQRNGREGVCMAGLMTMAQPAGLRGVALLSHRTGTVPSNQLAGQCATGRLGSFCDRLQDRLRGDMADVGSRWPHG